MGLLVDGVWKDVWYDTDKTGGKFKRESSKFRNWITADGSAGPDGEGGFEAEKKALSPLRGARLSLGAPHTDLPQAERP